MFVLIRVVGFAMILSGSTFIGIVISSSFSRRVHELQDIKSFLTVCETSMSDIGMHTEDILRQSQSYLKTGIKDILEHIYNKMQTEYPDLLAKIWEEQIRAHKAKLSLVDCDLDLFISIGGFLGSTGLENQRKQIQHITGMIDKHMEDAISLRNKNKKIALNMGIFGGLIIVLILL